MPSTKNIIIFLAIGAALVLVYIFFLKPKPETPVLVTTTSTTPGVEGATLPPGANGIATQDFLTLLLSVNSIRLDDSIFSDIAFITVSKHDSTVTLYPDAVIGRPNPFAPIGTETGNPVNIPTAPANKPTAPNPPAEGAVKAGGN